MKSQELARKQNTTLFGSSTWASNKHGDKRVLPLCPEHHRGKSGLHLLGRRKFEKLYECNVESLIMQTISLAEQT